MSETDPLDLLRAANPHPNDSTNQPQMTADTLFEQITTASPSNIGTADPVAPEPDDDTVASRAPHTARRWRPKVAMPAAAAVVAAVVGGVVLVQPGATPSASALVAEAAATSAGFEAGRVTVLVEVDELPGEEMNGSFLLDYRFEGDDFALHFDTSLFEEGFAGDDEATSLEDIEIRGVGDRLFSSFADDSSFVVGPRSEDAESLQALFGFQPTSMEPSTVVGLLEQTDDFRAVTTEGGMTTYRGSVTVAALEQLGPDSLPAGLALLAYPNVPNDDLPDTLGIDVVVNDGLLDTLTIEIDGDVESGDSSGAITTTFADYGEPQNIVAPPPERISDEGAPFPVGLPEGYEDHVAVIEEMEGRRPGLCSEVFADFDPQTATAVLDEALLAQFEAFPACLEAAGEQAAADAFRSLSPLTE